MRNGGIRFIPSRDGDRGTSKREKCLGTINSYATGLDTCSGCIGHTLSIIVSFNNLITLSPILTNITVTVHVSSPNPILFARGEINRGGRCFGLRGFESVGVDAPRSIPARVLSGPSRCVAGINGFVEGRDLSRLPLSGGVVPYGGCVVKLTGVNYIMWGVSGRLGTLCTVGKGGVGVTITKAKCINLSVTALLTRRRTIATISVVPRGIRLVGSHGSPVRSRCVRGCLTRGSLSLATALSNTSTCGSTSFIIVTTPAGCSDGGGFFSASTIRTIVRLIVRGGPSTVVIVGSAVPINFATRIHRGCRYSGVVFDPRFLHRSGTLCSGLCPSEVVINASISGTELIGTTGTFTSLLGRNTVGRSVSALVVNFARTRTIGLFTGACLTLHISCFGRLSACTRVGNLGAGRVVSNIYLSPHVNSRCGGPSFNCNNCYLPGSAGRLLTGCRSIPRGVVSTVIRDGEAHGSFVTSEILRVTKCCGCSSSGACSSTVRGRIAVNICHLAVGSGSSGFERSSVRNIVGQVGTGNTGIVVFRPALRGNTAFFNDRIMGSLSGFGYGDSTVVTGHCSSYLSSIRRGICAHSLFNES